MAQMYLVITIRKPIADAPEGDAIYELVKTKLENRPDLEIKGHVSNHFED